VFVAKTEICQSAKKIWKAINLFILNIVNKRRGSEEASLFFDKSIKPNQQKKTAHTHIIVNFLLIICNMTRYHQTGV